jgi:hypothetical protein
VVRSLDRADRNQGDHDDSKDQCVFGVSYGSIDQWVGQSHCGCLLFSIGSVLRL